MMEVTVVPDFVYTLLKYGMTEDDIEQSFEKIQAKMR